MAFIPATGGGKHEAENPFDNWPDLSDGEVLSAYSTRLTNYRGRAKKIDDKVYIELAGTLNIESTSSTWDGWRITTAINCITAVKGKIIDVMDEGYYMPNSTNMRGGTYIDTSDKTIRVLLKGVATFNREIDVKMIVHGQ